MKNKKIIISGASGGIGSFLTKILAAEGAKLFLVSAGEEGLRNLNDEVQKIGAESEYLLADFGTSQGIQDAANTISKIEKPDILINLAGISYFGSITSQSIQSIEALYNINLLTPVILSRAVLPQMQKNNSGQIVNIGSIFGSISFPFFATYSSSKAAVRSFSESLRREVSDTKIKVNYIAPRAVKTPINSGKVFEFLQKTKSALDEPEQIAAKILAAIKADKAYSYFGFPESLFVRINYLFPSLVDGGLKEQAKIAREILSNNLV